MGQANSRGSPGNRPRRDRVRPMSWAPSLQSPPPPPQQQNDDSTMPELQTTTHISASPRPISQRLSFMNALSTARERTDAGSSGSDGASPLTRRQSRISRARSSLSSIPSLFHRRRETSTPYASSSLLSYPSASHTTLSRTTSSGFERGPSLPRLQVPDLDLDFDELQEQTSRESSHNQVPRISHTRRDGRSSSMLPSFRREGGLRHMTSQLRRRRSPVRRDEDQAAMLSRLLSVAAAATAASLMGDDHRAVSEARNVAGDGEDGTFDSFLQALQNGRIASALRQSSNEEEGGDPQGGSPAPLNFFRMFRFGSSNRREESGSNNQGNGQATGGNQDGDEDGEGRMVPIIIVGIRSINPNTTTQDDNIPPFLDALSSFPTPLSAPGDNTMDGMNRQPQQRFSHRRRASMGGMNTFPSNYDNQRHYRPTSERPRPWSSFADSPSGPLPPPTTPASSGLSAISSGTNTPALSTSPPSPTLQSSVPSRRGSFIRRALEPTAEEPQAQPRVPRQRRMSESDFTRFGSGSSRRNGVVEPDHNPGEGSRSWIIYVLGGSYPENHPILTTPSLFTDSPTYEDMLLLSTLLGPAKPPVASEEDVAAAPGLFNIRASNGTVVAVAVEGEETVSLAADARCLVCLSDFEVDEEARRLQKCGHIFHRICIDQWLTTGRNSCPLCRGQGVDEKAESSEQSPTPDIPAFAT